VQSVITGLLTDMQQADCALQPLGGCNQEGSRNRKGSGHPDWISKWELCQGPSL